MTKDEFIAYEKNDGPVRLDGLFDGELLLIKVKGQTDSPLATQEQYESFTLGFAHVYADNGLIMRYLSVIGDLSQIIPVTEEEVLRALSENTTRGGQATVLKTITKVERRAQRKSSHSPAPRNPLEPKTFPR